MSHSPIPSEIESAIESAIEAGAVDKALAATVAAFGCQAGTVHFLRDGALRLAAHHGIPPHIAQIVETVPIGKGIAGIAAERKEPVTICNLQTDESGQARPAAKGTGMEGSLAVPMLSASGELRGVLGVAKATAHDWTTEQTDRLMEIAAAFGEAAGI